MNRPSILSAIRSVTEQENAEAAQIQAANEVVRQSVHPEIVAMAEQGRADEDRAAADQAIHELEGALVKAAEEAASNDAERHADAIGAVQREKHRQRHDLTATRAVDAQAIDIIRAALAMVANSTPTPAGLVKGAEIARDLVAVRESVSVIRG